MQPCVSNLDELQPMVSIVGRNEVPAIRSVTVAGVEYNLGVLKNYRAHPVLDKMIPNDSRISMAWVHLESRERLDDHRHPIGSLIIITEGTGKLTGDLEQDFIAGDIVVVPAGQLHGLLGGGKSGFWGISVQFEEQGLYESIGQAKVAFEGDLGCSNLSQLLQRNDSYKEFLGNPIFKILRNPAGVSPQRRATFLDYFQTWSDEFQRMMLLRSGLCDDAQFTPLFTEHLQDEFGHNTDLATSRTDASRRFDPVFESLCRWFSSKIMSIDNLDRTVLVHLVVERSAVGFYKYAQPVFGQTSGDHFDKHNELDSVHEKMGVACLHGLSPVTYRRLGEIQQLGWTMLNAMFTRLAEITAPVE